MAPQQQLTFGPFRLDVTEGRLWREGHVVALRPRGRVRAEAGAPMAAAREAPADPGHREDSPAPHPPADERTPAEEAFAHLVAEYGVA